MRFLPIRPLGAAVVALGLGGFFVAAAWAHHYRLESASTPAPFLRDGRVDALIEPSGVASLGDGRRVLVADRKTGLLHVVEIETGAIVGEPLGSTRLTQAKPGPSWAGMARDSDGNFYLIGSHSGKDDEERAAHSVLVRFRLRAGETPAIDDASVVRWNIARAFEAALRAEGLDASKVAERKIEGLAVRDGGGRRQIVIGLSQPDDKVRAFSADITTAPAADAELKLRSVFAFDAGRIEGAVRQLTSLEYVADMGGFVILTAAVGADNACLGNTIWYIPNYENVNALQYNTFEKGMKSSGLAVLGVTAMGHRTEIKLLMSYDNDPATTRTPSRFQTAKLVHERD